MDREALGDDLDRREAVEERAELANRVAAQDGRVLVLERHAHDPGQHLQPGNSVVRLKHRQPARPEDAPALGDHLPVVRRILHHAVRVHEIERFVPERQRFALSDGHSSLEALLRQILARERRGARCGVDAGHARAAAGKANHLNSRTATDV